MTQLSDDKIQIADNLSSYLRQPSSVTGVSAADRANIKRIEDQFYKDGLTEEGFSGIISYCKKHFIKLPKDLGIEEHDASQGNPFEDKQSTSTEEPVEEPVNHNHNSADWTKEEVNLLTRLVSTAKSIRELQESIPNKTLPQIRRKIYNLKLHKQFRGAGLDFNQTSSKDGTITAQSLKQAGLDIDLMPQLTQNLIISYTNNLQKLAGKKITFQ